MALIVGGSTGAEEKVVEPQLGGVRAMAPTAGNRRAADDTRLGWHLLASDLFALSLVWLGWTLLELGDHPRQWVYAVVAVGVTLVAMRALGLYQSGVCALRSSEVARTVVAALIGSLAFLAQTWAESGDLRQPAFETGLVAAAVVLLFRWRLGRRLRAWRSTGRFLRTVVLVGTNDDAVALSTTLASEPELGYRVGAVIGDRGQDGPWSGVPGSPNVEDMTTLAHEVGATGVIIVGSAVSALTSSLAMTDAFSAGLNLQIWPGFSGVTSRRLRAAPVSGIPFLYVEPHRVSFWQKLTKRIMDVTLAATLCVLSAPVLVMAAILIKLQDRGPVVYKSQRVGRGGTPITVFKLRTMIPDASKMMDRVAALNERQGGPLFKATNDPRVTRMGRFLRQTSIDEIPQLWNVLNGTMSLVGPRPALPSEVEKFDAEFSRRHDMRPGITGLWQIEARDNPSFSAYRRLDLAYVDNWSLALDVTILITTFHSVLARALHPIRRLIPAARA